MDLQPDLFGLDRGVGPLSRKTAAHAEAMAGFSATTSIMWLSCSATRASEPWQASVLSATLRIRRRQVSTISSSVEENNWSALVVDTPARAATSLTATSSNEARSMSSVVIAPRSTSFASKPIAAATCTQRTEGGKSTAIGVALNARLEQRYPRTM